MKTIKASHLLTQKEIEWAKAIRKAARADAELASVAASMSDLEFVQHALVAKDQVDKALVRMRNLRDFKSRYGITGDGSLEDSLRDLEACHRFFPNFILALGTSPLDGSQVLSFDFVQYNNSKLDSEESYAVCCRAYFHLAQASMYNVSAMRGGLRILGSFDGLPWNQYSTRGGQRGL